MMFAIVVAIAELRSDGGIQIPIIHHHLLQRCRRLHEQGIRLLVIAPRSCAQTQRASLSHGAQGMLVKPLVMRELAALIGALLAE